MARFIYSLALLPIVSSPLSAQVIDLEKIVRDKATQSGWTYGGKLNSSMFQTQVTDVTYENDASKNSAETVGTSEIVNDTNAQITQTFTDTKTTSETITHTTVNGVRFGVSLTAKINFIFEGGLTASYENSFSETNTKTDTQTQTWTWNVNIPVPPKSKVISSVLVQKATHSPTFKTTAVFTGAAQLQDESDQSHVWTSDLGVLFRQYPDPNVEVIDDKTIRVRLTGKIEATAGLSYSVKSTQVRLIDNTTARITIRSLSNQNPAEAFSLQ